MRRTDIFLVGAVWALAAAHSSAVESAAAMPLFVAGQGGYHTYRIPAMVVTAKGTVLAFCEGRKTSGSDAGDIDLLLRRSRDGGATWGPVQLVHEEGGTEPITIGNPCPIAAADGTVHLLFSRNNQRAFHLSSTDDGATFSAPREITEAFRAFDFSWQRLATGPVHGMQSRSGRLLVPVWLNNRIGQDYRSGILFSDDGGRTWKAGGVVAPTFKNCNECTVAELDDGRLLLNMRNRQVQCRVEALSADGGLTWGQPRLVEALVDPYCQGSLLSFRRGDKTILAFANAADVARKRLTVRLSPDGGRSWSAGRLVHEGPAAYSDLAVTSAGGLLCLFESGEKKPYERIAFARLALE